MKQILALLLIIFALGACTASPEAMARWEQEEADRKAAVEAALAAKEDREKSEAERLADLVFSHPSVSTFDEAWALPDSQFDLGLAYLLFAKDHGDQDFEISIYLKAIDDWAQEFHRLTRYMPDDEKRMEALGQYISANLGFRYDSADPKGHDPRNLYLNAVIDRKRGYCVSLSLLYVLIGRPCGLKLSPTRLPSHFGVLHQVGTSLVYHEGTDRGRTRGTMQLYERFRMSMTAVEEVPAYLSTLSDRQVFSTIFSNRGALAMLDGDRSEAQEWFGRAVEVDGNNLEARFNRAALLSQSGDVKDVQEAMGELNAILDIDGNFYPAWCWRADLLDQSGRSPEAMQHLSRARGIWPERSMAYVIEGLIHYRAQNFELSKKNLEIAMQKDPNDRDAQRNYEIVLEALGDKVGLDKFKAAQATKGGG